MVYYSGPSPSGLEKYSNPKLKLYIVQIICFVDVASNICPEHEQSKDHVFQAEIDMKMNHVIEKWLIFTTIRY